MENKMLATEIFPYPVHTGEATEGIDGQLKEKREQLRKTGRAGTGMYAIRKIMSILLFVAVLFSFAQTDETKYYNLTNELARIKMKHGSGYVKQEEIEAKDLHYGYGIGQFFIQGYSEMTMDQEGTPVFLLNDGDQIKLGFNLTQNLDALGGNSNYVVSDVKKGQDSEFGIEKQPFGRGCLILRKTDVENHIEKPEIYTDYLSNVANNAPEALIGPLDPGDYYGALDYEVQYGGILGVLPGHNDYKILFRFKIQTEQGYAATAAAAGTAGIGATTATGATART